MNAFKEYLKKNKGIFIFLIILIIIILFGVFCIFYSDIASNFTKDNPNGEFFKVILSVLGGIGIIYGLWINSQRIKAQNKQNKLVEDRNLDQKSYDADKRFGEAIGYLASENTSIILGGIYALHQLAKEDERYKPIALEVLTAYLRDNSKMLYENLNGSISNIELTYSEEAIKLPIIVQTILNILFGNEKNKSIFNELSKDLSNVVLINLVIIGDINNVDFNNASLINCNFYSSLNDCIFVNCIIKDCIFGFSSIPLTDVNIVNSLLEGVGFFASTIDNFSISTNKATYDIYATSISNSSFLTDDGNVEFNGVKSFDNVTIHIKEESLKYNNCNIPN